MFRPSIMLDLTTRINGEDIIYYGAPHAVPTVLSYLVPFMDTAYALPSTWEINFHTHIKQEAQLYFRTF